MAHNQSRTKALDVRALTVTGTASVNGKPIVAANPAAAITAPTGGATIDAQSRTAITAIIAAIQAAGITL